MFDVAYDTLEREFRWPRWMWGKEKILDGFKKLKTLHYEDVEIAKNNAFKDGKNSVSGNPDEIAALNNKCRIIEGEKDYYLNLLTVEQVKNQSLVKLCADAQVERDILKTELKLLKERT